MKGLEPQSSGPIGAITGIRGQKDSPKDGPACVVSHWGVVAGDVIEVSKHEPLNIEFKRVCGCGLCAVKE